MTDNPGAGNVLLRTLATILAQRLRQVDPQFYGLGAFGVVDTPDLPPQPEPEAEPAFRETDTTGLPISDAVAVATANNLADEDETSGLAPVRKRIRTGTMPLPDPDELEPL
jgi:hypothetical protein